jgi:hypothetical protein
MYYGEKDKLHTTTPAFITAAGRPSNPLPTLALTKCINVSMFLQSEIKRIFNNSRDIQQLDMQITQLVTS